jgi:hypothetical protein
MGTQPRHLIATPTGYAIVERVPGPYSFSPPIDRVLFELTSADMRAVVDDFTALSPLYQPAPPKGATDAPTE